MTNIYRIAFPYLDINTSNCVLNLSSCLKWQKKKKKICISTQTKQRVWSVGSVMVMRSYIIKWKMHTLYRENYKPVFPWKEHGDLVLFRIPQRPILTHESIGLQPLPPFSVQKKAYTPSMYQMDDVLFFIPCGRTPIKHYSSKGSTCLSLIPDGIVLFP